MKTIFITGGSRGLGLSLVKHFLELGNRVFATSRTLTPELESLIDDNCEFHSLDMSNPESFESAVVTCINKFGSIDLLINNASGMTGGQLIGSYSIQEIQEEYSVTMIAPTILTNIVVNKIINMSDEASLDIIFISSSSGLIGDSTCGEYPLYAASKAALIRLSDSINSSSLRGSVNSYVIIPHNIRENDYINEQAASYKDVGRTISYLIDSGDNIFIPRVEIQPKFK